jgi:1,2-diacylglycerol 3-alpha-glucosyltransferase
MNIVHVCLTNFYIDGMNYQENIFVKKHLEMGFQVTVIASTNGLTHENKPTTYNKGEFTGQFGERIIRVEPKRKRNKFYGLFPWRFECIHPSIYHLLLQIRPDIIFVHGAQTKNVNDVIKYKKHFKTSKIFADNHSDWINNNFKSEPIKARIRAFFAGRYARRLSKVVEKFWGTTPSRCLFLTSVYHVNKNKVALLNTGVDEETMTEDSKVVAFNDLALLIPNIKSKELVITGGKFDKNKNLNELLKAVEEVNQRIPNIHLIVFGGGDEDILKPVKDSKVATYVGWKNDKEIVGLLMNSKIAVFPGLHSVLWDEAVGIGIPCIFSKIVGFDHVDIGGNCYFAEQSDHKTLAKLLGDALIDDNYQSLLKAANSDKRKNFEYGAIARKAIGLPY